MGRDKIAVVGVACRLPKANNLDEFWSLLIGGGDGISIVPEGRWAEDRVGSGTGKEKDKTQGGFLKCPVDEFDAKFFGMSPKEVEFVDPQQRLLLEVTWEALEDAAMDPHSLRGTQTGIFTGTWTRDYTDLMIKTGFQDNSVYMRAYLGNAYGATAGRLAHFYGTTGSTVANESGCSSSMLAVGLACHSLRRKDVNLALACGVNLLLKPFASIAPLVAEDGRCKTFDAAADGFGRAEGCGVVVLKRLADAIRDGDNIRGIIRGYGEAQEGPSRSLGTPTVAVEVLAMKLALKDAEVEPWEVGYVEAHGTGTVVGDPLEMTAIGEVYSDVRRKVPLVVGSVKTNVGHTESVAGITGLIKTLLAFEHDVIPPHRNLTTLNPKIDLQNIPAFIPLQEMPWKKMSHQRRLAGINSFGFAGTDTHVILEEPPTIHKPSKKPSLPTNLLALSARSEEALRQVVSSCAEYARSNPKAFTDFLYTWNISRKKFKEFRAAVVSKDVSDFLEKVETGTYIQTKCPPASPQLKICFLFPGQATHFFGMAKELYTTHPVFKSNFDKLDRILQEEFSVDIKEALWTDSTLLEKISYIHPSIFVLQFCLTQLWTSWGLNPDVVLGHSLGEYAAAVAAGILPVEDAIRIVAGRAKLIEALEDSGKMIVVKAGEIETRLLLQKLDEQDSSFSLEIGATNSPDQTTASGTERCVDQLYTYCAKNDVKCVVLKSAPAIHSFLMDAILPELRKMTQKIKFNLPTCNFISSAYGSVATSLNAEYFVSATRNRVNFTAASAELNKLCEGGLICVDMGPQPVLSALLHRNFAGSQREPTFVASMKKNKSPWRTLCESIASLHTLGVDIRWNEFHRHFDGRRIPGLPSYPFQRKKFWFPVPKMLPGTTFQSPKDRLHPFVHSLLPTASGSKIFQTRLLMEELPFLGDHRINTHAIFPAAGYLEMIIAVVAQAFPDLQNSTNPFSFCISSFSIHSPLCLSSSDFLDLQVIFSKPKSNLAYPEDNFQTSLEVFQSSPDGEGKFTWVKHVTASLRLNETDAPGLPRISREFNCLKASFNPSIDLNAFYSSLHRVGLQFGPTFQSLQRLWRSETEAFGEVKVPSSDSEMETGKYFTHPVALDSMVQAIIAATSPEVKHLQVPIQIENFTWTSSLEVSPRCFVHVTKLNTGQPEVFLMDKTGGIVASMEGLHLVNTSVEAVEAALSLSPPEEQSLPVLQEVWSLSKGTTAILPSTFGTSIFQRLQEAEGLLTASESELKEMQLVKEACGCYTLQALINLGWSPSPGDLVPVPELISELRIHPKQVSQTQRLLRIISSTFENILGEKDACFKVLSPFPSSLELSGRIMEIRKSLRLLSFELEALEEVACCMSSVLQGQTSIIPILFGESNLAERIYTEFTTAIKCNNLLSIVVNDLDKEWSNSTDEFKIPESLKVIEIGAGTGGATLAMLPALRKSFPNFSYTFTDVSPEFFSRAERKFQDFLQNMKFQVLDIEKDPTTQKFISGSYDVVIASFVLHATADLKETVHNLRSLLKPNGIALILEFLEPSDIIDSIFGLVEGYWRFQDFHLRPHHCSISKNTWIELLKGSRFKNSRVVSITGRSEGLIVAAADGSSLHSLNKWLIWGDVEEMTSSIKRQMLQYGRQVVVVGNSTEISIELKEAIVEGIIFLRTETASYSFQTARDFLAFLQTLIKTPLVTLPRIVVVTKGAVAVGDQIHVNPHAATLWGTSRSFRSENSDLHCLNVDVDPHPQELLSENVEGLLSLLWSTQENFVAIRRGLTYIPKLTSIELKKNLLNIPHNSTRFALKLPLTRDIDDIVFKSVKSLELESRCVQVEVKASGLNFRDVFSVLKPISDFEEDASVGSDFSGVVTEVGRDVKKWRVGDDVIGCSFKNGALPSHVLISEDSLVALPSNWTFEEGSTVPVVFMTAFHCLVDIARLSKGDIVLIHAGAGGVGLAAIQVARTIGSKIIATAGSKRKRAYLRTVVGITDVFHSRDLTFAEKIKEVTNGRGVDVILNSLTGPGFKEASLEILRQNGRFVEMSKLNIWSIEDVRELRPDVNYNVVDLTSVSTDAWTSLVRQLGIHIDAQNLRPLPFETFEAADVRAALRHLQKAQAIGKVVLRMPQGPRQLLFDGRSSYLITGGFGGVGLEVAKWLSSEGVKFLILCGRSNPSSAAQDVISRLTNEGVVVAAIQVDVGDFHDCQRLLDVISSGIINGNKFPPLRGIHHCAGTLSNGLLQNQTWKSYGNVFKGKARGAWNLHQLTTSGNFRLETFVLYSSISALVGLKGQSNYAAANAFLDSLAHLRHSMGLPASSVNWGQWSQIGMGADLKIQGLLPISSTNALASMRQIILAHKLHTSICIFDVPQLRQAHSWLFNGYANHLFSLKSTTSQNTSKSKRNVSSSLVVTPRHANVWETLRTKPQEVDAVILNLILTSIKRILKLDVEEPIDSRASFEDVGLDSLMSVELKNELQAALGKETLLHSNSIFSEAFFIDQLAKDISGIVQEILKKTETPVP